LRHGRIRQRQESETGERASPHLPTRHRRAGSKWGIHGAETKQPRPPWICRSAMAQLSMAAAATFYENRD
jgi:hypothetical protein